MEKKNHKFYGIASAFGNVDHHNDVIHKGAYKETLSTWAASGKHLLLLWQHGDIPIGLITESKETDTGLVIKFKMLTETQSGRDKEYLLLEGFVVGLSVGIRIQESYQEKNIRHITKCELFEISLVLNPSNTLAKAFHCTEEALTA